MTFPVMVCGLFVVVRAVLEKPMNETALLVGAGLAGFPASVFTGARTILKR